MAEFQEDMLFKNVSNEDARIFLDILGKKSKTVKVCTKELQLFDPKTFRPDIILELDDEILIIELQSTRVSNNHHKRFHAYVAIADYNKSNPEKTIELYVLSTAEKTKQITYKVNKLNEFRYNVISLKDLESSEIINNIKNKIRKQEKISPKELILFSLIPVIEKQGNAEDYIDYVVDTLINLKGIEPSIKALAFGVEWLIVDKFIKDEQKRNILQNVLGDRMSLMYEYGENKAKKAEERIICNLLKSGHSSSEIARDTKTPLSKVNAIKRKYHI